VGAWVEDDPFDEFDEEESELRGDGACANRAKVRRATKQTNKSFQAENPPHDDARCDDARCAHSPHADVKFTSRGERLSGLAMKRAFSPKEMKIISLFDSFCCTFDAISYGTAHTGDGLMHGK
jgi:hypothetical protein